MSSSKISRTIISLVIVGLFAGLLSLLQEAKPSKAEGTGNIYLPLVLRNYPPTPTVFGAQVYAFTDPTIIQLAVDAKVSWVRIPVLDWSVIEPNAPVNGVHVYDWSKVPESSLQNIATNQMFAIATVQKTPLWAQKYAGVYCGPVAQAYFADFAAFLKAAVQRYSSEPYNVRYWEIGNEPDIDPDLLLNKNSGFGCWGDDSDPYYGGGYYADMLKTVYPAIKTADPHAQVLIGGLLLDCDPGDPQCTNTKPPKFFEGILRNGGGNYFDIVNYHGYPVLSGGIPLDENFPSWDQRGGVVLGKANFLREVMTRYGVTKPLLHTEGSLLCPEWNTLECDPPSAVFEDVKADYVIWLFVRAMANDIDGSVWYTFNGGGWRGSDLVGDTSDPNPAYDVFKFITQELEEAQYIGQPLGTGGDLRNFAFRVPGKTVWVVWSADGLAHSMSLPAGTIQVLDKFGDPVTVSGSILNVKSPVYLELP